MNNWKRKICLLLASTMIVCALAACSSGGGNGAQGSSQENTTSSQAGSGSSSEGTPTLSWYFPGNPTYMTADGYDAVMTELNSYLQEKIGVNLEIKLYSFPEYGQKCSTVISSGEPYDLMFTSDWLNIFATNAGSNAYLSLNDYLETYAPDAMADIPDYMWKAMTINGNIYAMPARQNHVKNDGVYLRKDIADALEVKGSSYANGDKYALEDLEGIYDELLNKYPGVVPDDSDEVLWMRLDEHYGLNFLAGFPVPGVVRFSDETTVIDQFKSDEFMEYCRMIRKWQEKGYVQPDFASYVTMVDQRVIDRKSENHMTYRAGFTAPHVASLAKRDCNWEEVPVPIIYSDKYALTTGVTQSMTAVGVNSRYPEKAVALYNLAYSDEYVINTMIYGIEGVNYNKISDTEVEVIADSNYARPLESFTIANQFNTWVEKGIYPADVWEQVKKFGEDAIPSKLFGFTFDSSKVKNEVANCSAIYEEYKYPLLCGAVDPETVVPELIRRMEQAGSEKIIVEMQRQVDEFLANN